jgi:hypothetical protein
VWNRAILAQAGKSVKVEKGWRRDCRLRPILADDYQNHTIKPFGGK